MDTSTLQFQIAMAVGAAVLGALFQNYVLPGRREGATKKAKIVIKKNKKVHLGDTNLKVSNDNRTYITLAAAQSMAYYDGLDAAERREQQDEAAHRRRLREIERASKGSDEPESEGATMFLWLALASGAIALIVWLYIRYRQPIITTVTLVVTVTLCFTVSCLITAAVRKVRLDWRLTTQVVVNTAVTLTTLWLLSWLRNPPFIDDTAGFEKLLTSPDTLSFKEVLTGLFSSDRQAVTFAIAYQVIGLVLVLAISIFVLWSTLGVLVIAGVATRIRINPHYVPGRLRRRLIIAGSSSPWFWAIFPPVLTALSAVLITGLAARLVTTSWLGISPG